MNEKPVRTPVIVYQTKQEPTDDFTGKFHMTSPVNFKITGIPVMEMVKNIEIYVIGCITFRGDRRRADLGSLEVVILSTTRNGMILLLF